MNLEGLPPPQEAIAIACYSCSGGSHGEEPNNRVSIPAAPAVVNHAGVVSPIPDETAEAQSGNKHPTQPNPGAP